MIQVLRQILIIFACSAVLGIMFVIGSHPTRKIEDHTSPVDGPPQELVFRSIAIFDGKTEERVRFAAHYYKASDCEGISHKTIFFKSPTRARAELEREIRRAPTIIERVPKLNERGEPVGERVVVQFEASEKQKAHAEIIWNENSDFHSIAGLSLKHVLEFESAVRSPSGKILSRIDSVQEVTFAASEGREGKTEEGVDYSEKEFRSSDCETVKVRTEYYSSPARAQEELRKNLKESTNIIERGSKLSAAGQPVGERVVAMFKAERPSEHIEDTVVIWTVNSELHSIRGLFTHVLELEKRNYPNN